MLKLFLQKPQLFFWCVTFVTLFIGFIFLLDAIFFIAGLLLLLANILSFKKPES